MKGITRLVNVGPFSHIIDLSRNGHSLKIGRCFRRPLPICCCRGWQIIQKPIDEGLEIRPPRLIQSHVDKHGIPVEQYATHLFKLSKYAGPVLVNGFRGSAKGAMGAVDLSWSIHKERDAYVEIFGPGKSVWQGPETP